MGGQATNLYKSNYCSYYKCSVHHNYHRLGVTAHLVTEIASYFMKMLCVVSSYLIALCIKERYVV